MNMKKSIGIIAMSSLLLTGLIGSASAAAVD